MTNKRFPHAIAYVFGLIILGGIGFFAVFGAALKQASDSPAVFRAILQLELTRGDAIAINGNPQRLLVHNNKALQRHLKANGWTWVEQLGAGIMYRHNAQTLTAVCGQYSTLYMMCDLDNNPLANRDSD